MQGGAYIASRSLRNRLKPDILFLQFFSAIFCRKKRHIEYILVVCTRYFGMFDLADRKGILETTTILSEYRDGRKPRF